MLRKACCVFLALAWVASANSGEAIRVVMAQNVWTEIVKKLIPDFERESGIKVNLDTYHEEQLSQKLSVEFTAGTEMDVFVTRPLNEGRMFARNGWYEDLAPYATGDAEYDFMDFTQAARDCTNINGVQICIPTSNECQVLYYRKDIFEAKGLKPPRTMDELKEVAAKVTDRAAGFYGVLMRGQRSPLVTQFSSFLYSFGGDWFDRKTMKATFDTPEALKAIDFYGMLLREYGPDGSPNMNWPQMQAIYQQGKGAMYIDASAHYPMLTDPSKTDLADRTAVSLFPAGPAGSKPYMVTAMAIAMYSGSKHKDAAWKFIRYMTDKPRTNYAQGEFGYQCARQSAFENPDGIRNFPKDLAAAIAEEGKTAVGYDRPTITGVQEARDILGEAVVTAMQGGDYARAARIANERFQGILDREVR
ncbi:MAG: sugar ABC transporter substrate-binding protein [Planctomycetota bacterium]|jgi:multiple sugar transport system substrate-binding protein|nr:sugar ABC transporter substrate-binding protein [Planctomycetota bacterium]